MEEAWQQEKRGVMQMEVSRERVIEDLIDEYEMQVTKLAYLYVKDWSAAQDITQEVFIKAFQALHQFNQHSSYKTWIYRIVINQCKDYKCSAYFRRNTVVHTFHKILNKSTTVTPEEELMTNEANDSVISHILALPIKYREIILLYYYEELTTQEIGDMLGINPSTVRTRLDRGREKLKKTMGGRLSNE
ncbi:sigma-70 family RNA polymerase sigma factor [Rossellomorea vietnamensis]|uniref:Sigma-70 family RNA polymerase sigma factor n=1 Tax=Rossellomorea vietnamensis TaxID=218284 RepID=A0ACD4C3H3_9BACI|nr:sigma-70 family RNA polymerase sigma factor [Rossellomorea vietnamensis]UXH43176.1 sigma-70 family RNA polymerase sigma factor [Rossellomorea vietnamensis]